MAETARTTGVRDTGKVLVLGHGTRAFLSVIRSLGRKGIRVQVGWCREGEEALRSRYVERICQIPPFSPAEDAWRTSLICLLERERYDLVVPCNDSSIIPLHEYRREFEGIARIYLVDEEVYLIANDKLRMMDLARQLDIRAPRELRASAHTDAKEIVSALSLPVVFKPRFSFVLENLGERQRVRKVYTTEELGRRLARLSSGEVVSVQEHFFGQGVGVEVLADHGEVLVAFQHLRVHEPLEGGGSCYRKSVPLHPELLEATARLMKALDYTGVAMAEFKVNPRTHEWAFIELNPRFWGSLPLAVAAGVDFPYYLYQLLVHGIRDFPSGYKVGLFCRNWHNDLYWLAANWRADRRDPTLATRPLWQVALEPVNLLLLRERSDTWVRDDVGPGVAELQSIAKGMLNKLRGLAASVRDAVWHRVLAFGPVRALQRRRALRAIQQARSVLFVCKGNICRSPFAHSYLAAVCPPDVQVSSAGYYPQAGRKCPDEAVSVAKEWGIDLTTHRSVVVDPHLVSAADVIFTFDEGNRREMSRRFPSAAARIHRISSLDPQVPISIADPYGKGERAFRQAYQAIAQSLSAKEFLHLIGGGGSSGDRSL